VNAKPLRQQWFFLCGLMNLILDLLGSLDEGKMQNQCFSHSQETLLNEKSLIEFAPLPSLEICALKPANFICG
jgi:hypothetical protein